MESTNLDELTNSQAQEAVKDLFATLINVLLDQPGQQITVPDRDIDSHFAITREYGTVEVDGATFPAEHIKLSKHE